MTKEMIDSSTQTVLNYQDLGRDVTVHRLKGVAEDFTDRFRTMRFHKCRSTGFISAYVCESIQS